MNAYFLACCSGAVLIGACLALLFNSLSSVTWWWVAILLVCVALIVIWRWRGTVVALLLMTSFVHMLIALDHDLPEGLARQIVELDGSIERIISQDQQYASLMLRVHQCTPLDKTLPGCEQIVRVRLGWPSPPDLQEGERWSLHARLRPIQGNANPGQSLADIYFLREALGATGSVRVMPVPQRISFSGFSLRSWLSERIAQCLSPNEAERWAKGLVLGDASAFTDDDWKVLNDSGTIHLVVVSGMHVGMVVMGGLWGARRILRLIKPTRWRLIRWPWLFALLLGGTYVELSGGGPAARRSWIMTVVVAWAASGHYPLGAFASVWLSLGIIVLSSPLMLLRPGLWLSFLAVIALLVGWRWQKRRSGLPALLYTQISLGMLMDGAVMLLYGRWMPASLPANLFAIPWVTSVMLPLGVMATIVDTLTAGYLGKPLWNCFKVAVSLFKLVLTSLTRWLPGVPVSLEKRLVYGLGMIMVGSVWLLPGLSRRFQTAMSIAMCPLLLNGDKHPSLAHGDFMLRLYDVGQGQLAEIQTRKHRMLYDTGPQSIKGNMPAAFLWPTRQHLDLVMVSHADADHSGGVAAVLQQHDVVKWSAPLRSSLKLPGGISAGLDFVPCRRGQTWHWDGVTFHVIWPLVDEPLSDVENQRSCVLLIEGHGKRVLITGDADISVEKRLLKYFTAPITALVSGHHGSATSSSRALLVRIRPEHVLHSAGYLNAYRHPADKVVRRLELYSKCQWNTAIDGALALHVRTTSTELIPQRHFAGISRQCLGVSSSR